MGYVIGALLFLGIIAYYFVLTFVRGVGGIIYLRQSKFCKEFSFDRINVDEEIPIIQFIDQKEGLHATLKEVADKLSDNPFFRFENLITYDDDVQENIAMDYLMSKKGLVSRRMAELGCFFIEEDAPKLALDAMNEYMKMIQDNIREASGTTIWRKEALYTDHTRNYVWCGSPGDPDYWTQGRNYTSDYQCVYRSQS